MSVGVILLLVFGIGACLVVPILLALLLPAVQKVREAAARTQSQNNLKQIAIAAHSHHDVFKRIPSPKHISQNGQAVDLSWRVSILPFIEQQALFQQFDTTLPWDNPRNAPFQNIVIQVYQSPRFEPVPGQTHYQAFTGPNTLFPDNGPRTFAAIPDGTSNTFLAAEAIQAVPWTKPADMDVQPNGALPLPPMFNAAMADGSVRFVDRRNVADDMLRKLIDPRDGNVIPPDWDRGAR
jgi:hypothetical protein